MVKTLAWGALVSEYFRWRVCEISEGIGIDPDWLMACMAFETGGTFAPHIMNAAGSGAVGLIQFMPQTAIALKTTTKQLHDMPAEEQLEFVEMYFKPMAGRLHTLEDTYMAILWPSAIGKPNDYVLFDKADANHPKRYIQNAGLDWNKDGQITKAEACQRVRGMLYEGRLAHNIGGVV